MGVENDSGEVGSVVVGDFLQELRDLIEWMDADLDGNVATEYKSQPAAQDWARVAKVCEEAGEAIDALIGVTGQNPRKGVYSDWDLLFDELCDVALTGLYALHALQHFTKSADETTDRLIMRARYHKCRRQA